MWANGVAARESERARARADALSRRWLERAQSDGAHVLERRAGELGRAITYAPRRPLLDVNAEDRVGAVSERIVGPKANVEDRVLDVGARGELVEERALVL